ncbi:alpha-glucan phosphorylase [Dyadobacter frigoris]|uniref:alpha-glucan family phosphorylase n=1 Tax=Dyadobacter frigoris TaxID=2576211 RepID=UPI0024A27E54|nr:alpha-glucan family phosphorylase [Dyadobacter frigoris]GLU57259.1 alpha-glucan phosphorylase [Dyadobacter frigoris]
MEEQEKNNRGLYGFLPSDTEGIRTLARLALDLRWSWDHAADDLWRQLDAELWELTRNPWTMLKTVSREHLEQKLKDKDFQTKMAELVSQKELSEATPSWFQQTHPDSSLNCIAYFSMEYMLSEALPIYVGGLGNVAGDQLKSASDLGLPVTAVGLLYQQGYFRQQIDENGMQQALFPFNDPGQLPVIPLRLPNGEWLKLEVTLAGFTVWLRTWQVQVGGVKLYLLDTNDMVNLPVHRNITSQVYGGGNELRIQQEIILGIGGWKLLKALNLNPQVCHMNEGHAAFLILQRARDFMKTAEVSFDVALAITRAGNLFTTHTAVAAGFDHFSPALMEKFLGPYASEELQIEFDHLMALGRQDPNNSSESFNMAYLAIHGSGAVNGVSRLHGHVSRNLFQNLFPRWPQHEVPVGHVTNGVHMPTWDSESADMVWTKACGKDRWRGELQEMHDGLDTISDEMLWQMRTTCRTDLVNNTRKRLEKQMSEAGESGENLAIAKDAFDPETLTLGFARRFVAYKRPNLLLHDEERFIRILTNAEHPVQLVIAGKAPPYDETGKALIQQWVQFVSKHNLYKHVVFLSDYDVLLAEQLVQGADIWVNTPRRPWEASGTSGMKVLVNGGLNLSELDGWWDEAYTDEVGWAIGDRAEHGEDAGWDASEANTLYGLLENQIVPEFYARNESGLPVRWIERVRKSMSQLTPRFSANRTVREYTEQYYLPAAANFLNRAAENGAAGVRMVAAKEDLERKWLGISAGILQIENVANSYQCRMTVQLNGINASEVSVEMYAEENNGLESEIVKMLPEPKEQANDGTAFTVEFAGSRPESDYTVRIIPSYENIQVPLEDKLIFWQH